jgi:hypothetical protein
MADSLSPSQARKAAVRWLAIDVAQHPGAAAEDRLDRCADHLCAFGLSGVAAEEVALGAWAALDGLPRGCRFDVDASTPWIVWVVDEVEGRRVPIMPAEILSLVGLRAAAA